MLEPQRQKCEHMSKTCCDLPCSDACPSRSPHHRLSHAGAHHGCVVVNALAAASFAVKQAVVFAESNSARLTVCTGALCHRQPAFCDTPLPNDRSLATGMQCSPAVRSRGLQVRAVAELWAAVASHLTLVTEPVCHPHHSHPAAPPDPKTLCEPAALCLSRSKEHIICPANSSSPCQFLGSVKSACVPDFGLLSRTWLIYQKHLLNLAAFWPAEMRCRS
jgi:hypothetical protein